MTPAQDAAVAAEIVDLLARRLPPYVDAAWLREQVGSLSLGRVKIRQLRDYLVAHADALTSGRSDGPTSRFTLLDALRERVPEEVFPALCVRCHRSKRLPYRAERGRSCQNCQAKSARKVCVRCGQFGQPVRREAGGVVCAHCHNRDRSRWEPCGACNKTARVITRRGDGRALCQSCAPRRRYTCAGCGRHNQPAQAVTDEGPICGACYTRRRIRDCERCRRASQYVYRRRDGQLLCDRCWRPPPQTCSRCGQLRLIDHGHDSDVPVCFACTRASRPQVKCARCRRYRSVHARLPIGPVCQGCSEWSKRNPASCAVCRRTAPLVAVDGDDNPICGACHGDPAGWTCQRCGSVDWINRERLCTRCVARDRNRALLAGPDGRVSQQLLPLLKLIDSDEVLTMLRRSPSTTEWTRLLAQLTSTHDALTHETLDDLPQVARVHHLRHVLVHAGVLPPRDEEVDSTALWMRGVLADTDPEIARIVRQYALWSVLRRTRGRPRPDQSDRSVRKYARRRIVLALELLTWLQDEGQQLATMTQGDLDRWLTGRSPGYLRIQDFVGWAQKQHLAENLSVPSRSRSLPENYTDESEHWQMLRRCIHDTELPHDVRVAGSLILLFGQTPTRLVRLTLRDVRFDGDDARVTLGRRQLALPSTFAALVRTQIAGNASRRLPLGQSADSGWIFPGSVPGQHADAGRLTLRLNKKLGLYVRPTRNRALCNLAAELPSPVLADLLGLHVNTANRWTRLVKSDWTAFVAERSRSYSVAASKRAVEDSPNNSSAARQ